MVKFFVLFEHAAGYALFRVKEYEETPEFLSGVLKSLYNTDAFKNVVDLISFQPFKTGRDALENMNSISEGILHPHLQVFLENNVPKKKKIFLGVADSKIAAAITECLAINCTISGSVPEILRGIRLHFYNLVEGLKDLTAENKTQLGLGHHYSRARVKFNVNRIDNMIIQTINIVDQLDKDINNFAMRVREWYSHHFPELIKIVPENHLYVKCVKAINDRKAMSEDTREELEKILMDSEKAESVFEVARSSMGMEISPLDMENVTVFADRVSSLMGKRKQLVEYLRSKMHSVAPNLSTLVGDMVGARLISQAGSLINLAKFPASTVQILGAEKALFRALKTRGNTPKYGLIYHSTYIGRASKSNKGRISRYLANKCSVAARIDCFRDIPTVKFGEKLRQQVEDRLKFYETGDLPAKNVDVMTEAVTEADMDQEGILKKIKKEKKKAKKLKLENDLNSTADLDSTADYSAISTDANDTLKSETEDESLKKKNKKNKKRKLQEMEENETDHSEMNLNESIPDQSMEETTMDAETLKRIKKEKKKAKKLKMQMENSLNSIDGDLSMNATVESSTISNHNNSNLSLEENDLDEAEPTNKKKKKKNKKKSLVAA